MRRCTCTCTLYVHVVNTYDIYRISSKSRRGEILFQGSVWCGDNSRAARFRGRRLQRSIRTHVYSFNNKSSYVHVKCPCAYGNCCRPLTMRRDFEGGVYWDELADRCGEISRAAGFRGAARFRGNTVRMCTCTCVRVHVHAASGCGLRVISGYKYLTITCMHIIER